MVQATLWNCLLNIKKEVDHMSAPISYCVFSDDGQVALNQDINPSKNNRLCRIDLVDTPTKASPEFAVFRLKDETDLQLLQAGHFQEAEINFLSTYIPFCFLSMLAKKYQRTISVAHFAQTLDGKIATLNGESKWIGNQENLIHAHRMRALCDGILIGNKTLEADQPKLTVRHVKGNDPKRIVLGTSHTDFSSLTNSGSGKVIVIGSQHYNPNNHSNYNADFK